MTEHPDAEALSAYLDGETADWEGHVRACAECRQKLDAFERVRSAVSAPVPPVDPADKDGAIAAAVGGPAGKPATSDRGVPRWAALAGVAAVAVGVLVGLVATRDTGSRQNYAAVGESAGPVSSDVVNGGDLGEVDDDTALRQKLEPHMLQTQSKAGASGEAATSAAASPPSSTPAEGAPSRGASAGVEKGSDRSAVPCEREARALQPGTEVLVYQATATWQGTPASVLGFSPPGAPATNSRRVPTRVYVLARSDCRLLSFQSYAP